MELGAGAASGHMAWVAGWDLGIGVGWAWGGGTRKGLAQGCVWQPGRHGKEERQYRRHQVGLSAE